MERSSERCQKPGFSRKPGFFVRAPKVSGFDRPLSQAVATRRYPYSAAIGSPSQTFICCPWGVV